MTDLNRNVPPTDRADGAKSRFGMILSGWTSHKRFPWLMLGVICALAVALRCLHLLNPDHYYILSPDSHFFHRMAELVAAGGEYYYPTQMRGLPWGLYSGLTYPVGLLAKAFGFITGMTSPDAVAVVAKFLPPTIGVVAIVVLWLVVSRMYGRVVAHLAAFAWAVSLVPVFFGAAGYLDRDGLSLLLVMTGVCVFYLMRDVHLMKGGLDFGWAIRGSSVLVFEALLFVEWGFLGPLILLMVLAASVIGEILSNMWPQLISSFLAEEDPLSLPLTLAKQAMKGIVPAIRRSSYKPVVLVLALSAFVGLFRPGFAVIYDAALTTLHLTSSGAESVGELQGTGLGDILSMQLLVVPLLVGLYVTIRKRRTPDITWLSWFVVLFAAGLFARRLYLFAAPAFCVLCGIGLWTMLDLKGARRVSMAELAAGLVDSRTLWKYLRAMVAVVLIAAIILVSLFTSYNLGTTSRAMAVTPEWQEALTWLRENTPEDDESKIMTWWDYGYWIFDLAHRVPVVDNGVHWESYDREIATVYCAEDDDEAVEIMHKLGARYLVFSELDIQVLPIITEEALGTAYGDTKGIPRELWGSLFNRSLNGQIEFGGGLVRVYPAIDIEKPPVVILALE